MRSKFGHYLGLILLTAVAAFIALTAGLGRFFGLLSPPVVAQQETKVVVPVEVHDAQLEQAEIVRLYSGMIAPFERYVLSFQAAGQIEELGVDEGGQPLDEGDRVRAGQILARLDERIVAAQLKEARARLAKAEFDLQQAENLRSRNASALTEAEYRQRITDQAMSEAAVEMAEKRLRDSELVAPVDGVISRRRRKAGEALNMHEPVFELIQTHQVLLALGVPESEIGEIVVGQKVHLELLGRDKFRQREPVRDGTVYRIDEAADEQTGLFEVEVLIDNPDGRLKPGLVASARVVIDTVSGYRLPKIAALFRDGTTSVFAIDEKSQAKEVKLSRWVEQESTVILPEDQLPEGLRRVVVRGQHRLVEDREVEITPATANESAVPVADDGPRNPTPPADAAREAG